MMGKIWRLLENLIVTAAFVAIIGFVVGLFLKPAEATPAVGMPVYCEHGDDPQEPTRCLDVEEIKSEICHNAYRRAASGHWTTLDNDNIVLSCIMLERIERLIDALKDEDGSGRWTIDLPLGSILR